MVVLYGKDKNGKYKVWEAWTEGDTIYVSHGLEGGKKQVKTTKCKSKNVGKANETSPEEQAKLELASKVNKQKDKGYREAKEELAGVKDLSPMLVQDYLKYSHKITYPCYAQPKLNGVRVLVELDRASNDIIFHSRGNKRYKVPNHLYSLLKTLMHNTNINLLDAEVYLHGMSLQNIQSAIKKENENTKDLELHIFDIPFNQPFLGRNLMLGSVNSVIGSLQLGSYLKVIETVEVLSEDEAKNYLQKCLECKYEGIILRNQGSKYEFGYRSYETQKWKLFLDDEALVVGVTEDKNGEGVLECTYRGVIFECKMKGDHQYRSYTNQLNLIGKWITFKYQEVSDKGVPLFPVGLSVRECDAEGNPLE